VRRNRALFVSSGAVALALIIGLGAATWMYVREREAREQAERAEKREAELRRQAEAKEQINQAAIYVSQNKFEDANEILDRISTLPTQPSFDGVVAYRRVGEWLALQQRWAEAADRYTALMEIDKLDAWQVVTLDYQACGVVLAECGDRERYNRFCRAAIERFRNSRNGDMIGRVLKSCLLMPHDPALMEELRMMAGTVDSYFRPIPSERFPLWPTIYMGLWEYRNGDIEAAKEWSRRGIERGGHVPALNATVRCIQAMADYRQGQINEATEQLALVRRTVDARFEAGLQPGDVLGSWYDWLFARILLREAASLIEGK
jgi:tetratricopeptide (TPR) repeat protein